CLGRDRRSRQRSPAGALRSRPARGPAREDDPRSIRYAHGAMYRTQGSAAAAFGVHAGPYTGPRRTFALRDLPEETVRRLADATHGRGSPTPILARAPGRAG